MQPDRRSFAGKRICALGLGRFGGQVAAIEHLLQHGAQIRITDTAHPETLSDSIERLSQYSDIEFQFGPQTVDSLKNCDALLASPAIRPQHSCIIAARRVGLPVFTEIGLFLNACKGRVLAISGTVGKSTTAAMLAKILQVTGNKAHLGGNIGKSLLPIVEQIQPEDFVVLELSSFQLDYLRQVQPDFTAAVLTNLIPHHLEWHGSAEAYREAKAVMFQGQNSTQLSVFPESQRSESWPGKAERVYYRVEDLNGEFPDWPAHDQNNAAATMRVARWLGIEKSVIFEALHHYSGLPHRLEKIPNSLHRTIINDSKSTSPIATLAAIDTLCSPTWIIIGGADSLDDPSLLLDRLTKHQMIRGITWVGPAGNRLAGIFAQQNTETPQTVEDNLNSAWRWCWENSQRDHTILMSPGYPSFNEFLNYEARGEHLVKLVRETEDQTD
ncbi:UDP-N-acetylmuramoyl-L-alanine--D-glutamate ligase [Rubinisphaera italica]|uniref:UDP-N-acetylmuramoylalanine--D-glutamate ligase n=1 Tax=Rubinisphaera italica TaxID=2527969 RepID=A0A5C5XKA9_9PLAN|nr:UDP-N-acetylmuramoyl-L-alanine--D-glutamate ligase [Rubinisphaera italica]TWT62232.1 UDP-N-acetylmuramoylalanine--D-glutamate ligase MurD [Rubinisphaera italica]